MSASFKILVIAALSFGLLGMGACGKDGDTKKGGDKAGAVKKTGAAVKAVEAPTKDEVSAIDCDKACKQQGECQKAASKFAGTEKAIKMCVQGCDMTKKIYDPKKHGAAAKALLMWNNGKCK